MACPFCERIARGDLIAENDLAAAFPDAYPLSSRHCLIVPRRHGRQFIELAAEDGWVRNAARSANVARAIYFCLPDDARLWLRERDYVSPDVPAIRSALTIDVSQATDPLLTEE